MGSGLAPDTSTPVNVFASLDEPVVLPTGDSISPVADTRPSVIDSAPSVQILHFSKLLLRFLIPLLSTWS